MAAAMAADTMYKRGPDGGGRGSYVLIIMRLAVFMAFDVVTWGDLATMAYVDRNNGGVPSISIPNASQIASNNQDGSLKSGCI